MITRKTQLFLTFVISLFVGVAPSWADDVVVADANGNQLTYSYDSADGPATFKAVRTYASDETKKGHIIIADNIIDTDGNTHEVKYISGSVSNRSNLVSIVFGKNIVATGGPEGTSSSAFEACSKLTSVTLNAKLEILGTWTFLNCYAMEHINLGDCVNLKTIKASAIEDCDLIRELTIPASVETIERYAFYSIDSLRTITFAAGSKLQSMGEYAFKDNRKMERINLEACTQLKSIGDQAFYNCYELRAITIPASIETMAKNVLWYDNKIETITFLAAAIPADFYASAQSLTTLNIGSGVKSIGNNAFQYVKTLKNLNIDPSVSDFTIGEYAFSDCDSLEMVSLPAGLASMGRNAFNAIEKLRTVNFAEESVITDIPRDCFNYNPSLEYIKFPNSVKTIRIGQFHYCTSLKEIEFGTGLEEIDQDWGLFYNCPIEKIVLPGTNYPFKGNSPTDYLNSNAVLYVNPDLVETYRTTSYTSSFHIMAIGATTDYTVTTTAGGQLEMKVPEDLSQYTMKLTVTGPLNGTDIDYLHSSFPMIEELNLKNARIVAGGDSYHKWDVSSNGSATQDTWKDPWNTENDVVGPYMFYNIPTLKKILLPSGATQIGEFALSQQEKQNFVLTEIEIPAGVTVIGQHAFTFTGITEVTVPAGVTELPEYIFWHCEKLVSATLPEDVKNIGNSAFSECYALENVNMPGTVETIGEYAFYRNEKRNNPIVFPSTLKTIGNYAFCENRRVKSITFNDGLETIGSWAFSDCNDVESISLPETVTTMYDHAFQSCDSITQFTFPSSITAVPDAVLYHCDKLQKVTLAAGTTSIAANAFENCVQLATINLTEQTTLTSVGIHAFANTGFTTMTLPNSITSMGYSPFRECKQLQSINVPTGLTTVPYDFVCYCPLLTSVQMHDGIRVVGHNAFLGCPLLNDVALNDQITTIEYDAFNGCESLELTKLPAALTSIGSSSLRNMKALTGTLTIPEGVTKIDGDAFRGSALSGVILPEGIKTMGNGLFYGCENLSSVQWPADQKRVPNGTFQNTTALKTISLPVTTEEIGNSAFSGSGLTSFELPDSIKKVESYSFADTQLQTFRVPDTFTNDLGSYTLYNCKRLKTVYFGRNQDYSQWVSFTCCSGCDSLELMRIYAGTPPKCDTWYMGYRTRCVLEVPEEQVDLFKEANGWKDFKEIRGFFMGDVLRDEDFATMQELYTTLGGADWKTPWNMENNHHAIGKWAGVSTTKIGGTSSVTYAITAIDLSNLGIAGELPASLFQLKNLQTLKLNGNQLTGDLGTLLSSVGDGEGSLSLTEVNLMDNRLTGDIYPFASKLPALTKLDLRYNRLTEISRPISKEKLKTFQYDYQFIDYKTHEVVTEGAPFTDITVGVPTDLTFSTLLTYRHNNQDYGFSSDELARIYYVPDVWKTQWTFKKEDGLWNLYQTGSDNYVLKARKNVVEPYIFYLGGNKTVLLRLDWIDGDVNADQTIDVADLQGILYYIFNTKRAEGQMFNFTTADANGDEAIDVRDVVGSVDYILGYEEPTGARKTYGAYEAYETYEGNENQLTLNGNSLTLANTETVAALQLTVSGATTRTLNVAPALKRDFSVSMRDVADGVRIVIYSTAGQQLQPGTYDILSSLPAGATVTDARLVDANARHLGVSVVGSTTGIDPTPNSSQGRGDQSVYDLQGRKLGNRSEVKDQNLEFRIQNSELKPGIYIVNGKKVVIH